MPTSLAVPHGQGAKVRMLPPPVAGVGTHKDGGTNPVTIVDRTYTCAVGAALTVPAHDADILANNGWTAFGHLEGTTAQRPSGPNVGRGTLYLDTTIGHVIVYDGATWREKDGTSV